MIFQSKIFMVAGTFVIGFAMTSLAAHADDSKTTGEILTSQAETLSKRPEFRMTDEQKRSYNLYLNTAQRHLGQQSANEVLSSEEARAIADLANPLRAQKPKVVLPELDRSVFMAAMGGNNPYLGATDYYVANGSNAAQPSTASRVASVANNVVQDVSITGVTAGAAVGATAKIRSKIERARENAAREQLQKIQSDRALILKALKSDRFGAKDKERLLNHLELIEAREANLTKDMGLAGSMKLKMASRAKMAGILAVGSAATLALEFVTGHLSWHKVDQGISDAKVKNVDPLQPVDDGSVPRIDGHGLMIDSGIGR